MPPLSHPSLSSEKPETDALYFAYGSNMYLPQIAVRCPGSTLFARGILRNYKFQTNNLGGGNVVTAGPLDSVEGIVFTVTPDDVQILRRYEGTKWQYFEEREVEIEVEPVPDIALEAQSWKSGDVAEFLTHYNANFNLKLKEPKPGSERQDVVGNSTAVDSSARTVRKSLVYISYKYAVPSPIRDEYVVRMHLAIAYARLLGVSKAYFEDSLYPTLFGKRVITSKDG